MSTQSPAFSHPVIGITGALGTGKSWLAGCVRRLAENCSFRVSCTVIQADELRLFAFGSRARRHVRLRQRLAAEFGLPAWGQNASLPVWSIYAAAFESREAMAAYRAILNPVMIGDAARMIRWAASPVIFEWAMLLEDGFANLVDHPVVMTTCSEEEYRRRLDSREIRFCAETANRLRSHQPSDAERLLTARAIGCRIEIVDTATREMTFRAAQTILPRLLADKMSLSCATGSR